MKNKPLLYVIQLRTLTLAALAWVFSPDISAGMLMDNVLQDLQVSGKVIDEDGEPLIGVNVIEKSTNNGTISDVSGNYSITVADDNSVLVFTYIGYKTQEVVVGNKTRVDIVMETDLTALDEVVVVGYGTQKKENLTGAVGAVNASDFENRPITSSTQALQGLVPGVHVNQSGGQPGSDNANITIRGIGTLNSGTRPLILIDGIESSLDVINPNDIESISVLKDAASAAIYGSRAANGVILVTTKRGKRDKDTEIAYDFYVGVQEPTRTVDVVTNSAQFMELFNEANINSGRPAQYSDDQIAEYRQIGPNTDWLDEIFENAPIQQHNLGVTGGSGRINYAFSLGYLDQEGVLINTDFERYNLRLNLDADLNDMITVGNTLSFSRGTQNAPQPNVDGFGVENGGAGIIQVALRQSPNYPVRDSEGRFASNDLTDLTEFVYTNPVGIAESGNYTNTQDRLYNNTYLEIEIIENLKIRGSFGANFQRDRASFFLGSFESYNWRTGNLASTFTANRQLRETNTESLQLTAMLTARYAKQFGKHEFEGLLGYQQESFDWDRLWAERTDFFNNVTQALDAGTGTPVVSGSKQDWSIRSFFGRLNYNYDNKYLFEANFRRDGSSRFAEENRWGTFPSFSAGWIISQESFFTPEVIDFVKLRASWGQLGNQSINSNYPFASIVSYNQNYTFGGVLAPGAAQTTLGNPDITWETTTMTNVGLDIVLFNNLEINADYFVKTTDDILFQLPVPQTSGGFPNPFVNAAKIENKGWELTTSYNNSFNGLDVGISLNVSQIKDEVLHLEESIAEDLDRVIKTTGRITTILARGEPVDGLYGFRQIGIFQSQDEIDNAPVQPVTPAPGDFQYADINGDGVVNDEDRTVIGDLTPEWNFGVNLNLGYKGFYMNAFLQGVQGYDAYADGDFAQPFFNDAALGTQWLARWTPDNPTNDWPRLYFTSGANTEMNSFWVLDRSFVRLKNLQFGYNFSKDLLAALPIESLNIYVNAQNLATWTDFIGADPERPGNFTTPARGYPQVRIFTGGVKLTF